MNNTMTFAILIKISNAYIWNSLARLSLYVCAISRTKIVKEEILKTLDYILFPRLPSNSLTISNSTAPNEFVQGITA